MQSFHNDLNLPEWLTNLKNKLSEGMSKSKSKTFSQEFLESIPTGITEQEFTIKVKAPFLVYVLQDTLKALDHSKYVDATKAVNGSISLWQRNDVGSDDWVKAAEAVEKVFIWGAYAVEWVAEWSTKAAAYAAAGSVKVAAYAAAGSVYGASYAVVWAAVARVAKEGAKASTQITWAVAEKAEEAAYNEYANKLLALLKQL
jgi:hypothetical protein